MAQPAAPEETVGQPQRRLPVLGQSAAAPPGTGPTWRCLRCGKRWQREPRPEEAL